MKKNKISNGFLILFSIIIVAFFGSKIYASLNPVSGTGIRISNITYEDTFLTYQKGDIVTGNKNVEITFSGTNKNESPYSCTSIYNSDILNGIFFIKSSDISCNFENIKQNSLIRVDFHVDNNNNAIYNDNIDYSYNYEFVFETKYSKKYYDDNITSKSYLLDSNSKIKNSVLPF